MRGDAKVQDRFWSKVDRSGECWLWTAATAGRGYGYFNLGGTMRRAHRLAYEWSVGPIPDGLDLDHLCRVRHCVNPEHLEPVTRAVNLARGVYPRTRRRPTHCRRGHPLDETNSYVSPATGHRRCRTCIRAMKRRSAA